MPVDDIIPVYAWYRVARDGSLPMYLQTGRTCRSGIRPAMIIDESSDNLIVVWTLVRQIRVIIGNGEQFNDH